MLKKLVSFFKKGSQHTSSSTDDTDNDLVPRYPPFLKGIPNNNVINIINTQIEIIDRIKLEAGSDLFNQYYLDFITRYCEYVHLLPASEKHHHRGIGGLFRHGLEVGFNTLVYAKGKLFDTHLTPSERAENEPKWYMAAFLAGLTHDLGKPLTDYQVIDESGQLKWSPFTHSLKEWLDQNQLDRYYLLWNENRYRKHESMSFLLAEKIIGPKALTFLSTENNTIIRQMFECITTQVEYQNKLFELVQQGDHLSVQKDERDSIKFGIDSPHAIPVEKYVVDEIKLTNIKNEWGDEFNEVPPIFVIDNALFIHAKAIAHIGKRIEKRKIPGVPTDPKSLTDSLIENKIAEPREVEGGNISNVWGVMKKDYDKIIWAVKFVDWSILYAFMPEPLPDMRLLSNEEIKNISEKEYIEKKKKKKKKQKKKSAFVVETAEEIEERINSNYINNSYLSTSYIDSSPELDNVSKLDNQTQPSKSKPAPAQDNQTQQPSKSKPAPAQDNQTQPSKSKPAPAQDNQTQPSKSNPAPAQDNQTQPTSDVAEGLDVFKKFIISKSSHIKSHRKGYFLSLELFPDSFLKSEALEQLCNSGWVLKDPNDRIYWSINGEFFFKLSDKSVQVMKEFASNQDNFSKNNPNQPEQISTASKKKKHSKEETPSQSNSTDNSQSNTSRNLAEERGTTQKRNKIAGAPRKGKVFAIKTPVSAPKDFNPLKDSGSKSVEPSDDANRQNKNVRKDSKNRMINDQKDSHNLDNSPQESTKHQVVVKLKLTPRLEEILSNNMELRKIYNMLLLGDIDVNEFYTKAKSIDGYFAQAIRILYHEKHR